MKQYILSWTKSDDTRVTDQIFTADRISEQLAKLEEWGAYDITIEEKKDPKIRSLAERIHKTEERLCSPGLEDEEITPVSTTMETLGYIEGCHMIIEWLLDNIEVME